MKISAKTIQKICIIAGLVIIIGGTITFFITWRNIGFSEDFITSWLSSFALCVAFIAPIGGLVALLLNRVISILLPLASDVKINLIFGLSIAVVMESIMSAITTLNIHGLVDADDFFNFWFSGLIAALPAGIIFSVILSLFIKPRLEKFWQE